MPLFGKREPENLYRDQRPGQADPAVRDERFANDQAALAEAEEAARRGDSDRADMLRRIIGD